MRIFLTMLIVVCSAQWVAAEGIDWVKDFSKAREQAKKQDKLMFVDFYTDWCGWCKRMDKQTMTDADVQKFLDNFIPVKIDGDKEKALTQRYGVRGYPTLALIHHDGTPISVQSGFKKPGQLESAFGKAQEDAKPLIEILSRFHKGKASAQDMLTLGNLHLQNGRMPDALAAFQKAADKDLSNAEGIADDANVLLGRTYYSLRDYAKALKFFKKAYADFPKSNLRSSNLIGLAKTYAKLDQVEKALPVYEEYIAAFPDDRFHREMKAEYEALKERVQGS